MAGANDYGTPFDIFQACERRWGKFDLDVCAHNLNAKCHSWYGEPGHPLAEGCTAYDGLAQPWYSRNWLNPPYSAKGPNGKDIGVVGDWLMKAVKEVEKAKTTVAILKLDSSTAWARIVADHAAEVHFLLGSRIRFLETVQIGGEWTQQSAGTPKFCALIAVFRPMYAGEQQRKEWWDWQK